MASLRLPDGTDDLEFGERLLAKGVAIGPGRYWGAPGSIRVTFSCSGKELSDGLEAISQILGQ
jgi:DNA-binding transcriptional MocR family regulator